MSMKQIQNSKEAPLKSSLVAKKDDERTEKKTFNYLLSMRDRDHSARALEPLSKRRDVKPYLAF